MHPVHLFKVLNDTVVPNSSTDRLIAAGGLKQAQDSRSECRGSGQRRYTFFTGRRTARCSTPTASLAATMEMQAQAVLFAATAVQPGGPFVVLDRPDVLDLN